MMSSGPRNEGVELLGWCCSLEHDAGRPLSSIATPNRRGRHAIWQGPDHRVASRPFNQRDQPRPVERSLDEVAFPITGHRPIRDLGRPITDHDLVTDDLMADRPASRAALGSTRPQLSHQFFA